MRNQCTYPQCPYAVAAAGYEVCSEHAPRYLLTTMLRDAKRERDEARAIADELAEDADELAEALEALRAVCVCGAVGECSLKTNAALMKHAAHKEK